MTCFENKKVDYYFNYLGSCGGRTGFLFSSNNNTVPPVEPSVKISYYAKSIDDLIQDSPYIVIAKVSDKQSWYRYRGVYFYNTQINVQKVLKGSIPSGKEITLMQTYCEEDTIVEKGSTVLLFLDRYEGPATGNAYVCQGAYQGQYKIDGKKILPSLDDRLGSVSDFEKFNILDKMETEILNISGSKS